MNILITGGTENLCAIKEKAVLITGGTGSFGQKFVEIILKEHNPKSVWIYSRGEILQLEMERRFNDPRLHFIIGDIRDKARLSRAMEIAKPDLVVHAAALKMIPPIEYNPIESVYTNVIGALNIIEVSLDHKVDKVFAISTDKACHPVNFYGACKMLMEKLFVEANRYHQTKSSCSRYGNVVDARGEILSVWLEQAKTGKLTITDERMTRFWLTIEEGVRFVISCIDRMVGGEIFIPKKLPSIRMIDLAKTIAPDAELVHIGIRPGEKLHESLISIDEARHSKEFDNYYIIEPELSSLQTRFFSGIRLPEGFAYTSWTNNLSIKEISDLLYQLG